MTKCQDNNKLVIETVLSLSTKIIPVLLYQQGCRNNNYLAGHLIILVALHIHIHWFTVLSLGDSAEIWPVAMTTYNQFIFCTNLRHVTMYSCIVLNQV